MRIERTENRTIIYADEGRAIRPREAGNPIVESVSLAPSDAPENWEDCDLPVEADEDDKDAALRRFGVEV